MFNATDPSKRALLYSEMLADARRLGDRHLERMARHRLGQALGDFIMVDGGGDLIPFPGFPLQGTHQSVRSQSLGSILLLSSMIPVGMAAILFAFIQVSNYFYHG